MGAYENALVEEGTRDELARHFLLARQDLEAAEARVAEVRGRVEKLGKLISAYDQAHERMDRGEKWIDIWQDYFVEKHSYKYWAGYMQQSILNAARAVCETRAS